MAKNDSALREALAASAERAWKDWTKRNPRERFYAFGLYTTPDGEYFVPTISGEDGLSKVAKRYVNDKSYASVDQARDGLRWSFADSPYHAQGERYTDGVEEALSARPNPFEMSESACDKEIKSRLDAAVDALKSLDARGVFGKGAKRKQILLVVEAGDRDQEWAMKLAKRLNPKDVYAAYAKQFEVKKVGKFTELGSKKVYETRRLARSADGKLLLAATEYVAFLFDMKSRKQLWARPARRGDDLALHGAALSADGGVAVVAWTSLGVKKEYGLTVWRSKGWNDSLEIKLRAEPLDIAMSPRGDWIAAGMDDNRISVFGGDGKPIKKLPDHKEWPRGLAASPDEKWMASADSRSGTILWDTGRWLPHARLKRPAGNVSFDGSASRLATALRYPFDDDDPAGQVATIWDMKSKRVTNELRVPGWRIRCAVLSLDGKRAACALTLVDDDLQTKAALLDIASGKVLAELAADFEDINDFAFVGGDTIAVAVTGHHRKPLILWKTGTGGG